MFGGSGNDWLFGGSGNDMLYDVEDANSIVSGRSPRFEDDDDDGFDDETGAPPPPPPVNDLTAPADP
mgnify:FL=1